MQNGQKKLYTNAQINYIPLFKGTLMCILMCVVMYKSHAF